MRDDHTVMTESNATSSPAAPVPPRRRRLSELLREMADAQASPASDVTLEEIRDELRDRAFGPLILIFAAPNLIPNPIPGVSSVLGMPLLFLAAQLMMGARQPWLPKWLARRGMNRLDFRALVGRVVPWLQKAEKLLKPRMLWLMSPTAERFIGGVALLMAMVLFLPIVLGNWLPALSLSLLALGVMERDGLAVLLGLVTAVAAVVVVAGVLFAMVKAALLLLAAVFAR